MESEIAQVGLALAAFVWLVKTILPLVLNFIQKKKEGTNGNGTNGHTVVSSPPLGVRVDNILSLQCQANEHLLEINKKLSIMQDRVVDLHKWHDKDDDDGVKVWYLRPSIIKEIHSISSGVSTLLIDFHQYAASSEKAMETIASLKRS